MEVGKMGRVRLCASSRWIFSNKTPHLKKNLCRVAYTCNPVSGEAETAKSRMLAEQQNNPSDLFKDPQASETLHLNITKVARFDDPHL